MTIILAFIAIILSLILVVGIHEAGHALSATFFGVKIERISIGFGKPLYTWTRKSGIEWVWAKWPLGGYVTLLNNRIAPVPIQDYSQCFDKKPVMARIIILASGALANLIVAWIALVLMFVLGYTQHPAIVHDVIPKSIAAHAGLTSGDKIIGVANADTPAWREVGMGIIMHLGADSIPLLIQKKSGLLYHTQINLKNWQYAPKEKSLLAGLGITLDRSNIEEEDTAGVSLIKANQLAYYKIKYLITFFLMMIKQLCSGVIPLTLLLGPVGLFKAMADSFLEGVSIFSYFIATLSLAVAVANLLPIPGLDGGSIVYSLLEKIRGKPLSVAFEVLLYQLACIAFCLLLVQLIINDLERFLGSL